MKLEGSHTFKNISRQEVWDLLMDPDVIAKVMPGCEKMEPVGDDSYEAVLTVGFAAIKGKYTSKITLFDKNPPERYKLRVEGKGARGFLNGEVTITLEEKGGDTLLHYVAENQIGGPIAAVGQRLVGSAARMIVNQGFKALEKQFAERRKNR
ncbi:MAG: carbon monoxide dehydrogenase [Calditrichaeota bacterium]|nr:MAG: carbon monoxide dehydrogenase [Calditrichota bacterium]